MKKVTDIQIKEWKKKYGELHQITVPLDDDGHQAVCYVRKPDRKIVAKVAKVAESNEIKASVVLFENCWLDGDASIKKSDEAIISVSHQIMPLFKVRRAAIKKL